MVFNKIYFHIKKAKNEELNFFLNQKLKLQKKILLNENFTFFGLTSFLYTSFFILRGENLYFHSFMVVES